MKYSITAKNGENIEYRWNLSWLQMIKYKFAYKILGWSCRVTKIAPIKKWRDYPGVMSLWKY